jgi:hypothetical protein
MPKGRNYLVLAAILREMSRQNLGTGRLSARLRKKGYSWSEQQLILRLGELLPLTPDEPRYGGRHPLRDREVAELAAALGVPVAQLVG